MSKEPFSEHYNTRLVVQEGKHLLISLGCVILLKSIRGRKTYSSEMMRAEAPLVLMLMKVHWARVGSAYLS